jgi:hypothetical protein
MKEYYSILELAPDCTKSDIRKAYRRLAKKYHPDVNKSKNAFEKFIEISEAYEFLISQSKRYKGEYASVPAEEEIITDFRESDEFQRFRQNAREKAEKQAKMRYAEFKKQQEAFQQSGFNDLVLLLKITVRIALIPLFFFLLMLPVYIAVHNEWQMIFLFFLTWPFAGIIGWYAYDQREQYFKAGKFYYTIDRIKQIFNEINPTELKCYYCPTRTADSKPYRLDLLRLKEIKVHSEGFRQHNVNFINDTVTIIIPRSRKAFISHSICTLVKIIAILYCLIFLDFSSFVWRIIIGIVSGGIISSLVLIFSGSKSNVSYLLCTNALIRLSVWIFLIALVSHVSISPFNITTSGFIYLAVTSIIIFDCFLMQAINLILGKLSLKPLIRQFKDVTQKFNEGYILYNDVAVVSFIYPLFKWIFG